jgi:hypothetical protein
LTVHGTPKTHFGEVWKVAQSIREQTQMNVPAALQGPHEVSNGIERSFFLRLEADVPKGTSNALLFPSLRREFEAQTAHGRADEAKAGHTVELGYLLRSDLRN